MAAPAPRRSRASRVTKPTNNTRPDQRIVASVRYRYTDSRQRLIFSAPSQSTPDLEYMVVADDEGQVHCSCPAGARGRRCKHAVAVQEWLKMRALSRVEASLRREHAEAERVRRERRSAYTYSDYEDYGRGSWEYTRDSNPHECAPARYDPHGHIFD